MDITTQKRNAKKFIENWQNRGHEKQDSQSFWLQLLRDVLGVEEPEQFIKFEKKVEYTGQAINIGELCELYLSILQRNVNKINKQAKEIEKIALYERVTVQDKVKQIVDYLNTNENMVFNKMFNPKNCDNIEVVTAFLGALELSKLKQVNIEQQYLFSDINISKINDAKIQIDASKILD